MVSNGQPLSSLQRRRGGKIFPSPLPVFKKTDQEGLAQRIKIKNPKFMSVCEMRAYTLRCNVALLQATYPSRSQPK
jgi:hypothetical protein